MTRQNGISIIPCKINGLKLNFVFDTGASDVSLSITEASFMLKNGYLESNDILGTTNYLDANGDIHEGITINLKEIEIQGMKLYNVKASVTKNLKAPLLLGQTAINKLGTVLYDSKSNTLTVFNDSTGTVTPAANADMDSSVISLEEKYVQAGIAKAKQENYRGSLVDFAKALRVQPNCERAYFFQAISLYYLNYYKDEIKSFDAAIRIEPTRRESYYLRGLAKASLRKFKDGIKDMDSSVLVDPSYADAYASRGDFNDTLKNFTSALEDYNRAITIEPGNADNILSRARLKLVTDDLGGALEDYNSAITIRDDDANIYYNRGFVKYRMDDFDGAAQDYDKAIELDPKNMSAIFGKAFLKQSLAEREWIEVINDDEASFFIRSNYISKENGIIKIWVKSNQKHLLIRKNGKPSSYSNVKHMLLVSFDCQNQTSLTSSSTYYDSKGSVISSSDDDMEWKDIVPETRLEKIYKKVCETFN